MNWQFNQQVDLQRPGGIYSYPDQLVSQGDHMAVAWRVTVYDGSRPADLTGYGFTGFFNRRDGKTVPVVGTADGNIVSVVLPQGAYESVGPLIGILRGNKEEQVITMATCRWNVRKGPGEEIVDTEDIIPSLDELLSKIGEMERQINAANVATTSANNAASAANTAANTANNAASNANTKATAAQTAADKANVAATNADTKAAAANTATGKANTAADKANAAAGQVDAAIQKANTAAANADEKASAANTATGKANTAATNANTATGKANTAANKANTAANRLSGVALDVTMLPPSATPTANVTQTDTKTTFLLGIPTSNLAYATFEVDENMELLMHSPEGFNDIGFQLNNGVLEVSV